jgi:hypothetical protein
MRCINKEKRKNCESRKEERTKKENRRKMKEKESISCTDGNFFGLPDIVQALKPIGVCVIWENMITACRHICYVVTAT